jgi:hypothetical protein
LTLDADISRLILHIQLKQQLHEINSNIR